MWAARHRSLKERDTMYFHDNLVSGLKDVTDGGAVDRLPDVDEVAHNQFQVVHRIFCWGRPMRLYTFPKKG